MTSFVVGAEAAAVADRVDDEQVGALAARLGPAVLEHAARLVAGLGGEADDDLVGAQPVGGELGEDVDRLDELEDRAASPGSFLILVSALVRGR